MHYQTILKSVLSDSLPSSDERKKALNVVNKFVKEVNSELKSLKINAVAVLGGSYSKDTWLSGDYDVDLFVKFDLKYKNKNMSDLLAKVLKKWKPERLHGSRDYLWLRDTVRYEIVPVLNIKKASDALNVTDFSPLHVNWVNNKGKKFKDDIRIAKRFCKAAGCYGAESYIRGFSGHVIDILTIHNKGFIKLLKSAVKWKSKVVVDYNKMYKGKALLVLNKSKTEGPLVVVDPVQPGRNAAAALMQINFNKFIKAAKAFLKKPSKRFFEEKIVDFEKLKKKGHLLKVSVRTLDDKEDVAGTKFVRAFEFVKNNLDDFSVKDSGWIWDKKAKGTWWFVLGKSKLPPMKDWKGPPTKLTDAVKAFKKIYKKTSVKGGRVWAKVKRETSPDNVLKSLLKNKYVKSRVKGVKL